MDSRTTTSALTCNQCSRQARYEEGCRTVLDSRIVFVFAMLPEDRYLVQGKYEEGYGTVLDSGTTFTYLPSDAFAAFRDKVSAFATAKGLHSVKGPDPKFHDICFGGAPHVDHPDQLSSVFPSLELKFAQVPSLPHLGHSNTEKVLHMPLFVFGQEVPWHIFRSSWCLKLEVTGHRVVFGSRPSCLT